MKLQNNDSYRSLKCLYDPAFEHDSCGVGFVADISGHRSHEILEKAVQAVVNLTHRGAFDADAKTGDGAGLLTQIPERLFRGEVERLTKRRLGQDNELAVGMIFLPRQDTMTRELCRTIIEEAIGHYDLTHLGWRQVPINPSVLGDKASETRPDIQQVLIGRPAGMDSEVFNRTLYLVRREIENSIARKGIRDFYIPSFSSRVIVYKGLVVSPQLRRFYLDLQNPFYETALAVFHQRYSTNTFPTWFLAHPFRMLAHNGEINALQGNRNWMRAREPELRSALWGDRIEKLKPIIQEGGSDSASLDNVLESVVMSGRGILHAVMMLVPEAYQQMPHMDPTLRGFYEYHSCITEPWDGPADLAFSDGRIVGAALDRNGLRPVRYKVTEDGLIVLGSEVGIVDLDERRIVEKGRLGPGKVIAVDTVKGVLLKDEDIKREIASQRPYVEWVRRQIIRIPPPNVDIEPAPSCPRGAELVRQQIAFGYTADEIDYILEPMTAEGKEPVGSMGDDTPLAVLSEKPRLLYAYFKQRFAQVTNPPIDPLREDLVMSLNTAIGRRRSLFEETEEHARLIKFSSPLLLLLDSELARLRAMDLPDFKTVTLSALFEAQRGKLQGAVERLCEEAEQAVDHGASILIISDRGVDTQRVPIPMLLAVGAVHHDLIRRRKRMRVSLIAEAGDARDVHHIAALTGYGVSLVNPYLAIATIYDMVGEEGFGQALQRYRQSLNAGVMKVMSKMGISTLNSYRGAQIFEAVGLSDSLIQQCFTGTPSMIGGIGYDGIETDILRFHRDAFGGDEHIELEDRGYYRFRNTGEYHAFNPFVFKALHKAVRSGNYEDYRVYAQLVETRLPATLRDLLEAKPAGTPIPIEEVEPVESIVRRFVASGMSHGALSREAHETIAIAMNRLGAKSNSGEGGEDPARYHRRPNGDWSNSVIKQVASARFGVTPNYLASAKELEIKMAQGSKPGEGGQLPGHKVSAEIAFIRHSVPGVTLISPPPHHDIYSIEDIAQLIYDLKHVNPRAKVCVKLVAEAGVGTIAAGVAKAYADVILISGHEGGTGASPVSSIKHAGGIGELGLAETQQVLVLNGLRGRVTLRTDGGLKTGRDVVISAMLGAEEFGFGTASVIAAGCVMARQCHLNTCPVGVATQDERLRSRFPGKPEMVVNFFTFIAQEVREILAQIGFRTLDEIIGRTDLLMSKDLSDHPKAKHLDLSAIFARIDPSGTQPRRHIKERNDRIDAPLDDTILQDAKDAIAENTSIVLNYEIRNTHRAVGAKLAGEIAFHYGDKGLDGIVECRFRGSAGQSFGAFSIRGMRLVLIGEANDYVGKGMAGGEIIVRPQREARFASHKNTIMGNTVMYGATGGALYAAGRAGERFCVRNSGGRAVVEGVGDHGCEYMTGGVVVVLGETGRNFGAGMTGGIAYVLDERGNFSERCNLQLISIERMTSEEDIDLLQSMIGRHLETTNSRRTGEILNGWEDYLPLFWKVVPHPFHAKVVENIREERHTVMKL